MFCLVRYYFDVVLAIAVAPHLKLSDGYDRGGGEEASLG